jgi:hypothetical protein
MAYESLSNLDKRCIFRETFNSAQDTAKNGGAITGTTFSNGIGTFNGTGYTKFNFRDSRVSGTYSVRIKFRTTTNATQYLTDFRGAGETGTGFVYLSGTSVTVSSGTRYVNGSAGTIVSLDNSWQEVIVSGITLSFVNPIGVGVTSVGTSFRYTGDIELVEIYKGTLTATEVAELYKNGLYKEPNLQSNTILDIDPNAGLFDKQGNTLTNTSVNLINDGGTNVGSFNASTSKLSFTTSEVPASSFANGFSLNFWFKVNGASTGSATSSGLIGNGEGGTDTNGFTSYFDVSNNSYFIRINSTPNGLSSASAYSLNKWHMGTITVSSAGAVTFYTDMLSKGTASINACSQITTAQDLTIGNIRQAVDRALNGSFGRFQILNKVLTQSEITKLYNSQKRYYQ